MQTLSVEAIRARIAALQAERDQVRAAAEKQLFAYEAAIGELQRLIKPATPEEHTTNATTP